MDYVLLNDDSGQAGMTANSGACRTILESGRRRNYFRRPPTPPGIRFRTKAVPINALVPNLNACRTISAQPYLVDSVHYFRLRPSLEDSAQFGQSIDSKSSTGSGLQSIP